jgi:protein TonB
MLTDRPFKIALLVSITTHGVVFFSNPNLSKLSIQKAIRQIEVTYYQIKETPKTPPSTSSIPIKEKIEVKKTVPLAQDLEVKRDLISKLKESLIEKPIIRRDVAIKDDSSQMAEIGRRVEYLNYYQIVREEIRRCAYRNYSRGFAEGEAYISFTLLSNGQLKEAKIIDEKSTHIPFLKEIALKSIRDASPFPPFPKDINSAQLSFNVIISFEMGK